MRKSVGDLMEELKNSDYIRLFFNGILALIAIKIFIDGLIIHRISNGDINLNSLSLSFFGITFAVLIFAIDNVYQVFSDLSQREMRKDIEKIKDSCIRLEEKIDRLTTNQFVQGMTKIVINQNAETSPTVAITCDGGKGEFEDIPQSEDSGTC